MEDQKNVRSRLNIIFLKQLIFNTSSSSPHTHSPQPHIWHQINRSQQKLSSEPMVLTESAILTQNRTLSVQGKSCLTQVMPIRQRRGDSNSQLWDGALLVLPRYCVPALRTILLYFNGQFSISLFLLKWKPLKGKVQAWPKVCSGFPLYCMEKF